MSRISILFGSQTQPWQNHNCTIESTHRPHTFLAEPAIIYQNNPLTGGTQSEYYQVPPYQEHASSNSRHPAQSFSTTPNSFLMVTSADMLGMNPRLWTYKTGHSNVSHLPAQQSVLPWAAHMTIQNVHHWTVYRQRNPLLHQSFSHPQRPVFPGHALHEYLGSNSWQTA